MYQRKSRLTPRQQSKLIEHFVAGTTGRARLRNWLGFSRTRQSAFSCVYASWLPASSQAMNCLARLKRMRVILVAKEKASVVAARLARLRSLAYSNVAARFIQRSSPMRKQKHCCLLLKRRSDRIALSTRIHSGLITLWTCQTSITCASTTQSCLRIGRTISMGLRISGIRPSGICANLTASNWRIFTGFWRSASGASTEAITQTF